MARTLIQSNLDAVVPTLAPSQCNTEVNQFVPIYFSSSKHKMKYLTQLFLCKYFFWQSLKRSPLCHQVSQGLEPNFEPDLVSTHTFTPQELFQEEVGTQYLVFFFNSSDLSLQNKAFISLKLFPNNIQKDKTSRPSHESNEDSS